MRDPEYDDRFFELIHRAEDAQYGPDTGPWLEQAIRLADEQADPEYGLLARYFYVFAVAPVEPANAVVAFTWITSPYVVHSAPRAGRDRVGAASGGSRAWPPGPLRRALAKSRSSIRFSRRRTP